jgi:hypothetical protein
VIEGSDLLDSHLLTRGLVDSRAYLVSHVHSS